MNGAAILALIRNDIRLYFADRRAVLVAGNPTTEAPEISGRRRAPHLVDALGARPIAA